VARMSDRRRTGQTPAGRDNMPVRGADQEPGASPAHSGAPHSGAGPSGTGLAGTHQNGGRILRVLALIAVATGLVLLTVAACVFSYSGIHALALDAGVSASLAKAYPAIFDAVLVVAGCSVLALRGAGIVSRIYAWLCLLVLLVGVAGLAAVHAAGVHVPHRTAGITAAIVPWALVLVGFGLLLALLRHGRLRRNNHNSGQLAVLPAAPTAVTPGPDIAPAVAARPDIAPAVVARPDARAPDDGRLGAEAAPSAGAAQPEAAPEPAPEPAAVPTPAVAPDPKRSHEPVTMPGLKSAAGTPWTPDLVAPSPAPPRPTGPNPAAPSPAAPRPAPPRPAAPSPAAPSPAAPSPATPSSAGPSGPSLSAAPGAGSSAVDPVASSRPPDAERRTPTARPAEMQLRARVARQQAAGTPRPSPAPFGQVPPDAPAEEPGPEDARTQGSEPGQPPSPGELNAAPTVLDEGEPAPWPAEPPAFERPHSSPTPPED
jgi:hypothetical protein